MGVTKKGTVLSWLAGNFNNDYDFAKNLDSDTKALQAFNEEFEESHDKDAALKNLKALLLRYKNLLKTPTKELLV